MRVTIKYRMPPDRLFFAWCIYRDGQYLCFRRQYKDAKGLRDRLEAEYRETPRIDAPLTQKDIDSRPPMWIPQSKITRLLWKAQKA